MFKMLNPRRFYYAVGKRKFWEFIILAVFIIFFYGPLLNMVMLAFADKYEVPHVLPEQLGFKWWGYIFGQKSLVTSMIQSFIIAIVTTLVSMVFCIPAAYSIARFKYKGRKLFMLSFLLTNAFPKLGIYTSVAVLFYKYGLMGTYPGVVIIHMINSMMFMVWLPASAFRSVHKQQEEAARDVGAGPIRTFFKVTLPMAMPGISVATLYTFLGSMEEAQGTMLVGMGRIQTMPVAMYGIILDSSAIQIGAVFAILLILPSIVMIFLMRRYIGPEAIAGGFKMKYLPLQYADHINMSDPPQSVFTYLEQNYNIVITQALTELFIPLKDDPLRRLLELPEDKEAFGFRQSHTDSRGNPVLYALDYLRSDLFNFTVMRVRP